jgi:hypothetical protein
VDWLKVVDWIKGSVPLVVASWIASAVLVFTSLGHAFAKFSPWPLGVFVFTSAYILVLGTIVIGKKTMRAINRRVGDANKEQARLQLQAQRIEFLHRLNPDATSILRLFFDSNRRTIELSAFGLEVKTANILARQGILISHPSFVAQGRPFTIEDWVWDYLSENPHLLS